MERDIIILQFNYLAISPQLGLNALAFPVLQRIITDCYQSINKKLGMIDNILLQTSNHFYF